MNTLRELLTGSPEETEQAGERLGRSLLPGDVLLLAGDLGAGKTTLVRGLARGLGVEGAVQSPTFQLVRVHAGAIPLGHVDLYRLDSDADLGELGLDELLEEGVVVVEWGSRLLTPPAGSGRLDIEPIGTHARRLTLNGPGRWTL